MARVSNETLDLLILALAILVMPAMSLRAGMRLSRETPPSFVPRYWATILRGWLAAAGLLFLWWLFHRRFAVLGLDIPVGNGGRWGFLLDALLVFFFAFQQWRLGQLPEDDAQQLRGRIAELKVTPRTAYELMVFLLLSLTAGVWEELIYRGFLVWYLEPREGVIAAVVLSSMVFGLGHAYQGWRGVLNTTLVGVAFATAFVLTRSLWWLMAAHAIIDMSGGLVAFRVNARFTADATVKVNPP